MNTTSLHLAALAVAVATTASAAVPRVSNTQMTQAANRLVTITYELADGPAVITLDIETNVTGTAEWVSIGGENIQQVTGDVWKKVETGSRTIQWRPDLSWPDHKIAAGGARAAITAWALDNTPDYMAVDVSAAAQPNTQTYYPAADFVPGGVTSSLYKTTMLLMRKIMAKNVTWTMGSSPLEAQRMAAREATHQVTLTNNYYIGVFPITQSQWKLIHPNSSSLAYFSNPVDSAMRPMEMTSYNGIRSLGETAHDWPAVPHADSFLGRLRTKTGIDFDLPSEAQWEFAARAGNGDTKWGDGSAILNQNQDSNLDNLGRYKANGGFVNGTTAPNRACGAENGTSIVGSYKPNNFGIYDMYGNVWEWCLDLYKADIAALNGAVNMVGTKRVIRGGNWSTDASACRPAYREQNASDEEWINFGCRVTCSAGLQ